MKISVLIPAYNEEAFIFDTVKAVGFLPEDKEILVVDDCSTDQTAARAKAAGAKVITLPYNMGKGEALNQGAKKITGDIVLLLDADLGSSAGEARHLLWPVLNGEADLTIARFPPARQKGGFGFVKGLAGMGIRYYTGIKAETPLSGQRAMRRTVFLKVLPLASHFGVEVSMTIKAARLGFRVCEVPVQMRHKETGRNLKGFIHRSRQFYDVLRVLVLAWRA